MDIEELKKQIEELKKEVAKLKVKRIYQMDIIPASIHPRHLVSSTAMAKGDLFYSDGTNFVKIPIGITGQTLKVQNGVPTWV